MQQVLTRGSSPRRGGTLEVVPVRRQETGLRADLGRVCDLHPKKSRARAETGDVERPDRSPAAQNRETGAAGLK